MDKLIDLRVYNPEECAVFCKTNEKYGKNSNMAAGFPIVVNGNHILTSEALYQSFRFPEFPKIQRKVIEQKSPMTAKMVTKPFRTDFTRKDWDLLRVTFMRWALRAKLLQNWETFSKVILETGELPIVEFSSKHDDFWGAVLIKEYEPDNRKRKPPKYLPSDKMPVGFLVGYNVLGRLLMELRQGLKTGRDEMSHNFTRLEPLPVENFLLFGEQIREILRK